MANDYTRDGKVIRPPIESISSGRVFKPSKRLRYKYWFEPAVMAILFWLIIVVVFFGTIYLV